MNSERLLALSDRWFRLLQRLYPPDFADTMGPGVVETYRDQAREALAHGGIRRLGALWVRALVDSARNGAGEHARPAVKWRRSGNWGRDAELATRRLLRAPAFTFAAVSTLGIGLGLFSVVYTVVQTVLIDPLPYKNSGDLYYVWRDYRAYFDLARGWLGGPDITELQRAGGPIEAAVGLQRNLMTFAPREGVDATEIAVMFTSPNLFDVLGVGPTLGRGFSPNEVGPKRPPVIVLTHDLWNRLGADRSILGANVRLNGEPYTVIGVLPSNFEFVRHASLGPPLGADAYITFPIDLASVDPAAGSYAGLVRARHGATHEAVAAVAASVARVIDERAFGKRGLKLYPVAMKADLIATIRPVLVVLAWSGALLLLVLAVNFASVLVARAAQREHEFAVSRALGANGAAVVRATVVEGGMLGLAGGVIAAIAAAWGTRLLVSMAPLDLPRRAAIAVDWRIASVVIVIGALLGMAAAMLPATWAARASLASLLANSAVRGGGGRGRLRRAMVVVQVAVTVVLLCTGGLVVRSFDRLLRADPGFNPEGVLTLRVPMPPQLVPKLPDAFALQERIEQALRTISGVTGVSATSTLPLTAGASQAAITIPGAPGLTGNAERDRPLVDYIRVRPEYPAVIGMRLVEGRTFEHTRRPGLEEVLIDRSMARQFFPTGSAIGAKIPFGPDGKDVLTVVGVVEQARMYDVHKDDRPQMYFRSEYGGSRSLTYVVRTERDPLAIAPEARAAVRQVDARLAVAEVRPLTEVISDALRQQRVSAVMISSFAVGAVVLAGMGLFGIVSGSVTRRRHELALRLAVGADHSRLMRLVLSEGAMLVSLGVLIGAPVMYVAGGILRGVLVGVSPFDPVTLVSVAAGLAAVTLVACYVPARRVLRIDPAQSLRAD